MNFLKGCHVVSNPLHTGREEFTEEEIRVAKVHFFKFTFANNLKTQIKTTVKCHFLLLN